MVPNKAMKSSAKGLKMLARKARRPAVPTSGAGAGTKRPREPCPPGVHVSAVAATDAITSPSDLPRPKPEPQAAGAPPVRRQLAFSRVASPAGQENKPPRAANGVAVSVRESVKEEKAEEKPEKKATTRPAKRARSKAFAFSQLAIPIEVKKTINQRVAEYMARAPAAPPSNDLTFEPVSVFAEMAQFRGLDDADMCLDFLFLGKGDRQLGSAEVLRRRMEAREPLVGDFFCERDVLGQGHEDHHDSFAETAPGVIHYRLEGESAQPGDEEYDEAEAEYALVDPFASLMDPFAIEALCCDK